MGNAGGASRGPRQSVSAEAFGNWNKKEDFNPPVNPKTDAVKKALADRLDQAFMFNALNPTELEIVLNAMVSVTRKAGETIINQGEDGQELYVVESGVLSCSKLFVSYKKDLTS